MKAFIFKAVAIFLFFTVGGISANAQKVLTTTYYGTKARADYKNPCKGETVRVCGKTTTTLELISSNTITQTRLYAQHTVLYSPQGTRMQESADQISIPLNADPYDYLINLNIQLYPNAVIELESKSCPVPPVISDFSK